VDVISSYIKREGLSPILPIFSQLSEQAVPIRVFTTLQRRITDIWSLDTLAGLPHTSVYLFLNDKPNFHAKG
jgi:HKD family nuclease